MAEEIRDMSFETWAQLCACAREGGLLQVASELLMEFLKRILPKFDTAEVDVMALTTCADGIGTCLKKAGPGILSNEQVRHICQVAMRLLGESLKRREESEAERRAQQDEDGDVEEDEEETEEQALRVSLCEIAGSIMQHHPDVFVAEGLPIYLPLVTRLLQPGLAAEDRRLS